MTLGSESKLHKIHHLKKMAKFKMSKEKYTASSVQIIQIALLNRMK